MNAPQQPSPPECFICKKAARYRCPACQTRTCSLECVKQHKERTGCTGQRERVQHVAASSFTDTDLHRDFVFLEEALRAVEAARRARERRSPQLQPQRARAHGNASQRQVRRKGHRSLTRRGGGRPNFSDPRRAPRQSGVAEEKGRRAESVSGKQADGKNEPRSEMADVD
ncbi:unnamed protein product [Vitrella brassicaformis CCMP3155]|uniref:HIT-type domain-containing protein n=2 Tax=Vitrella brassicaformis TaxID=1169539 RepID=A0A0G4ET66_VITBC|nr:unnamed protein product [Vitrella brassicaformis CCMP3155]|eukprot:CEM01628.1 unnamed protein product [Vitrella brassicaformis CCMP3155]